MCIFRKTIYLCPMKLLAMPRLRSPRGVMPGGSMGADVLRVIVVINVGFPGVHIPCPQPQLEHGWNLLQGTATGGELVPGLVRPISWRVGGGQELPDLLGRLFSALSQPGVPVTLLPPVVDHLASIVFLLPQDLPLSLLIGLARPRLDLGS